MAGSTGAIPVFATDHGQQRVRGALAQPSLGPRQRPHHANEVRAGASRSHPFVASKPFALCTVHDAASPRNYARAARAALQAPMTRCPTFGAPLLDAYEERPQLCRDRSRRHLGQAAAPDDPPDRAREPRLGQLVYGRGEAQIGEQVAAARRYRDLGPGRRAVIRSR
jgi:hypothetical protein